MPTQLRDYRIVEGQLDRFVEEWRTNIVPIRSGLGFTIEAAWTVDGESRFLWLLSHPGDWKAFEAADHRYHTSAERAALDPDPARLIREQTAVPLSPVMIP